MASLRLRAASNASDVADGAATASDDDAAVAASGKPAAIPLVSSTAEACQGDAAGGTEVDPAAEVGLSGWSEDESPPCMVVFSTTPFSLTRVKRWQHSLFPRVNRA